MGRRDARREPRRLCPRGAPAVRAAPRRRRRDKGRGPRRHTRISLRRMKMTAQSRRVALLNAPRRREAELLRSMIDKGVNSPLTSSLGRLFDAAAAIANVRHTATYEGQPAIEFEACAAEGVEDTYPYRRGGCRRNVHHRHVRRSCARSRRTRWPASMRRSYRRRFHNTVAAFLVESAKRVRDMRGLETVALGGGVFQNDYLLTPARKRFAGRGFRGYHTPAGADQRRRHLARTGGRRGGTRAAGARQTG